MTNKWAKDEFFYVFYINYIFPNAYVFKRNEKEV